MAHWPMESFRIHPVRVAIVKVGIFRWMEEGKLRHRLMPLSIVALLVVLHLTLPPSAGLIITPRPGSSVGRAED